MRIQMLALTVLATLLLAAPAAEAAKRKPKPNLKVAAVSAAPTSVAAGSSLTVANTVRNTGPGNAPASQARVFLSTDAKPGKDVALGNRAVPALKAGKRSAASTRVVVPAATKAGSRFVIVCADAKAKVGEASETDNCKASGIVNVTAAQAITPPNVPGKPGITLKRDDAAVQGQLTAAGDLMYERASFGASGQTAEYFRIWLMANGTYRLNVIDWNSVSGEICRTTRVGSWAFAQGYTFPEGGGGIVLVLSITTGGQNGTELFVFGNSEPDSMYLGQQGILFQRNNNMAQNC